MKVEEMGHKYSCSVDLMEAVRALDYKAQYKVCEVFYKMIFVGFPGEDMPFCRLFNNLFERINPNCLEDNVRVIRQCVNEMDNLLSDIDDHDPATFYELADELAEFIEGTNMDGTDEADT